MVWGHQKKWKKWSFKKSLELFELTVSDISIVYLDNFALISIIFNFDVVFAND